jgi:hypothetical protein
MLWKICRWKFWSICLAAAIARPIASEQLRYATTHPWEDFAETWAHYLHIVDTLEMAEAFDLRASPQLDTDISANVDFTPYAERFS